MEETREERIDRLVAKFRSVLKRRFPDKGSTMQEIEESTEEVIRELGERIEETAVDQECRGYVGRSALCGCGRPARYVRDYSRCLTTLHGDRVINRSYYYCGACGRGFCPVDEILGDS